MAVATPVAYAAASGQRVLGGRFPAGAPAALSGAAALASMTAGGGLQPAPPPPGTQLALLSLQAGADGVVPFTAGHGFRRGDIPAGSSIVATASGANVQATIKSTWPDNSVKFAILAGTATISGGTAALAIAAGAAATGPALTTADLIATGVTAEVTAGAFGSASFGNTEWAAPFLTWVSGHRMSSWVYRKPIGSDAHLVAWLEVRLYAGGAVEVLQWVENGYLLVAGPTNKNATYTFSLGGTQRFTGAIDLKHHQRTPLVSGAALSHWLGADPGVALLHDAEYLQRTELVPTYMVRMDAGDAAVAALPATFTPLAALSFDYAGDNMASAGFASPIGLLPNADAMHLCADEADRAATFRAAVRNGFAAGRYGIHYRDENTNRPPRLSAHPTLVFRDGTGLTFTGASSAGTVTPAVTGGNPPAWDTAHSPTVGLLAYLLTGRFYFMEEVQFAAIANHFNVTDWMRANGASGANAPGYNGGSGVTITRYQQTRLGAWWFRSVAQALTVTPDDDTGLRTDFTASVQNTIDVLHAKYIAQTHNPYGWIQPGEDYSAVPNSYHGAAWQQDFVTAALGWGLSLDLPISGGVKSKFQEFFAWKARSAIGRLGGNNATDWWHINAVPFRIALAPTQTPDFEGGTGPWYPSWRAAYDATYSYYAGQPWIGATEGILAGEIMPGANGQWGNFVPAIAYAVRHNVPGAQAAYDRLTQSANWPELVSQFRQVPVWGVMPARSFPTWAAGLAINEVRNMPGGQPPRGSGRLAFCGLATQGDRIIHAAAGGHNDSSDNGVDDIDPRANTPVWAPRIAPSASVQPNVAYYSDGLPSSRHTYNSSIYNAVRRRLILHRSRFVFGDGIGLDPSNGLDTENWVWDPAGTIADSGSCMVQDTNGRAYSQNSFFGINEYDPVANTRTFLRNFGQELTRPMAFDTRRKVFFQLSWGNGDGGGTGVRAFRYGARFAAGTQTAITFNAGPGLTALQADQKLDTTLVYAPMIDRFFYWTGDNLYRITPNSGTVWDIVVVALTGATIPLRGTGSGADSFARLALLPGLGCLAILARDAPGVQLVRIF